MIAVSDRSATRRPWLVGAACGLCVAVLLGVGSGILQSWEDKTLDLRFGLRQAMPTDPRIILIVCDDASVSALGRWPWDRAVHALMTEILTNAGAKALVFDIVFSAPSPDSDARFMKALAGSERAYLPIGVELVPPGLGPSGSDPSAGAAQVQGQAMLLHTLGPAGLPWEAGSDSEDLPGAGRVFMPEADLAAAASGLGHVAANRDSDGVIRRVPLVVRVRDRLLPALSLRAALGAFGVSPDQVSIVPGRYVEVRGIEGQADRRTRIPVDAQGQMLVNYAGPGTKTFLPHHGFSQVLAMAATPEGRREIDRRFKDALVLILTTATGFDLKAVPLGGAMPGGLIHAHALNTILTERWLRPPPAIGTFLTVSLMGLAGALAVSTPSWVSALLRVIGAGLAYMSATVVLFMTVGYVWPIIAPMLAFLVAVIVVPVYERTTVRARLLSLEQQLRDTESALTAGQSRLEAHDREFDRAIDEARTLRETAMGSTSQVLELEARLLALDGALHTAHVERDRLVAQAESLERRVHDLRPVAVASAPSSQEQDAAMAECAAHGIITGDRRMLEVFQMVKKVAVARSPVLLMGETGTGKELLAGAIHALSPRARGPFVAVNMAAITETLAESELFGHARGAFTGAHSDKKGRFEQADQGTLFMDEIGELPLDLQTKLLRVLQTGEVDRVGGTTPRAVDVRIVAATNRNLAEEVAAKRFREDLYYRLNVVPITLPPLRERPRDVDRLAQHFLQRFAGQTGKPLAGFSARALESLHRQSWRGNVRDLRNAIERAVLLAEGAVITDTDLGFTGSPRTEEQASIAGQGRLTAIMGERDITGDGVFLDVMRELQFEIDAVAQRLGISRGTVASRFKGICFHAIVAREGRMAEAAETVAGVQDSRVEAKISEYYNNLLDVARQFPNADLAVLECRRRFKNLPQRYFPSVEQLIRNAFLSPAP